MFMGYESGIMDELEVSIVDTDSATTQRRRGDFGAVKAAPRACEAEKRALPVARQIQNDGSNKVFVPFVMSSAGVFGPGARKFLKFLYKSSRERNCWEVGSGQPQIQFHLEHPARICILGHVPQHGVRGHVCGSGWANHRSGLQPQHGHGRASPASQRSQYPCVWDPWPGEGSWGFLDPFQPW